MHHGLLIMTEKKIDSYGIARHLHLNFPEYLSPTRTLSFQNPLDVCGICIYFVKTFPSDTPLVPHLDLDFLGRALREIKASHYVTLLEKTNSIEDLYEYKNEQKDKEIPYYDWGYYVNEECTEYLSTATNKDIENALVHFPPLIDTQLLMEAEGLRSGEARDKEIMKLLKAGANPNVVCENGRWTPLACLVAKYVRKYPRTASGKRTILKLLELGANPSLGLNKSLINSYLEKEYLVIDFLNYGWDVNYSDDIYGPLITEFLTSLFLCNEGNSINALESREVALAIINHMLTMNVNLNCVSRYQKLSPLCYVASVSHPLKEIAKDLADKFIAAGAELVSKADNGLYYLTPLMRAAFMGDLDAVKYWREMGIDVNHRLAYRYSYRYYYAMPGFTALDIARLRKNDDVCEYLLAQGGEVGEQSSWIVKITAFTGEITEDKELLIEQLVDKLDSIMTEEAYLSVRTKRKNLKWDLDYLIDNQGKKGSKIEIIQSDDKSVIEKLCKDLTALQFTVELI